jgi:hypothetical protein
VNDVVKPLQESVIKQAELIKQQSTTIDKQSSFKTLQTSSWMLKVIPGFLARICSTLVSSIPDLSKSSAE